MIKSDGSRHGPYEIAAVPTAQKYTLSDEYGAAVSEAEEIAESALEPA